MRNIIFSAATASFFDSGLREAYEASGSWPDDGIEVTPEEWQTYGLGDPPAGMQRGADKDGRPTWLPVPPDPIAQVAERKRHEIQARRFADEATGVTINGVRYAGDPGSRQTLRDAIELANETGQTTFATWKCSDGQFHAEHPVADVRQAMLDISTQRNDLIAREGALSAQIDAAVASDDREALEAIVW